MHLDPLVTVKVSILVGHLEGSKVDGGRKISHLFVRHQQVNPGEEVECVRSVGLGVKLKVVNVNDAS